MGDVIAYRPKPDPSQSGPKVGMILFLSAWGMLFVSLFFTWAFVRAQADVWPPPDTPTMPRHIAWLATAAVALCAAAWFGANRLTRAGRRQAVAPALALAFLSGAAFVGLHAWAIVVGRQIRMGGSYGSLFMTMLFFHALLAATGLPAPVVLFRRALRGLYSPQRHIGIRVWGAYWYFTAALWVVMFGVLYFL
ncbi:MAG: cytochrome c oxidase subunit 3 [Myxococcaceae bacterium]|nr:cytochrome c oxidase subunit 3 [Myxococcaceae bacterium]